MYYNCALQGCGYVQFATTEEADEAMKLDGKELLGRYVMHGISYSIN